MKKKILLLIILNIFFYLQGADFPPGVFGTVRFDYFREAIPQGSRGIYHIFSPDNKIKYIGSSCDIYKRLSSHNKKGLLQSGDTVWAIVFHNEVRQIEILDYERFLIGKFTPIFNKHTGAPGRGWRSEEVLKLKTFFDHNVHLLKPESRVMICNLLTGKKCYQNKKMSKNLLSIMRLFL